MDKPIFRTLCGIVLLLSPHERQLPAQPAGFQYGKFMSQIPPPPAHLWASYRGTEYGQEWLRRYRVLYAVEHSLPLRRKVNTRNYCDYLGLLAVNADGSLSVTKKGRALFLTNDPAETDAYIASMEDEA